MTRLRKKYFFLKNTRLVKKNSGTVVYLKDLILNGVTFRTFSITNSQLSPTKSSKVAIK